MNILRNLEEKIKQALKESASIVLIGPRQIGKTTLAINICNSLPAVYLDLEDRLDLQKVSDIKSFYDENRDKLIILDEIQRLPEVFSQLRGIIDRERRKDNKTGLFLFLGSASIELLKQSSESLAGRIAYTELYPLNILEFAESNINKINQLWLRGGFPNSLLSKTDKSSLNWRNNFIKTYLERDIPQLGPRIPATTLERLWIMLAHNQGTTINASQLANNLDISSVTVARYLDLMVDLLLIRRLKPWTSNIGKRLVKTPKVYVRDSGLTHTLLNISNYNDLLGHPIVGTSWEGFVIENIMSVIPSGVQAFYYRTSGGAEIDLILEFWGKEIWAIEIKRSSSPKLSKGFYSACNDINPNQKFVIYSGSDRFSMGNDITAIPLVDLMNRITEI
jgi:predicted AAA+ superfamily ATPase